MLSEARTRTVLVTGASAGIGRAVCAQLLASGHDVVGVDRSPAVIETVRYRHILVDLSDPHATRAACARITADSFVHAAGFMSAARIGQMDAQALAQSERMWAVHVNSATVIANALVPHMRAQRDGRIVLIGSRVASGFPGRGQYAASKAALIALARSWAAELIADGVTVNVISPAATATPMLDDARRASSSPQIPPIGRLIEPSEIAAAVEYFLSTAAGAVTGQNLNVCGGASLQQ